MKHEIFAQWGDYIKEKGEFLQAVLHRTEYNNKWLTKDFQNQQLDIIVEQFLSREALAKWTKKIKPTNNPKNIGIILSAGAPLQGFEDIILTLLSGNRALIKVAEYDKFLIPHLLDVLKKLDATDNVEVVEKLQDFDAIIFTEMPNNNAMNAYFNRYQHFKHKANKMIAVLNGQESTADFKALGKDLFDYYGLGQYNVSKMYLPKGYDFTPLMETLHEFNQMVMNSKYKNNFDYNFSLYQLNKVPVINNGAVILVEDNSVTSRIAVLHYEYYNNEQDLQEKLIRDNAAIKGIVATNAVNGFTTVSFGEAHRATLDANALVSFLNEL